MRRPDDRLHAAGRRTKVSPIAFRFALPHGTFQMAICYKAAKSPSLVLSRRRRRFGIARMIGAFGVRRDLLRIEQYVAKSTLGVEVSLVGEMNRGRMSALAAAHDGLRADR